MANKNNKHGKGGKRSHKHNGGSETAPSKYNGKHGKHHGKHGKRKGHKRNDGSAAGRETTGMLVLKAVGSVALGVAAGVVTMLVLSSTSISSAMQDVILIGGGLAAGAISLLAGAPRVALTLAAGPIAIGLGRRSVAWGITSRAQELVDQMRQMGTSTAPAPSQLPAPAPAPTATTPSQLPATTAPGGYPSPYWTPQAGGATVSFGGNGNYHFSQMGGLG